MNTFDTKEEAEQSARVHYHFGYRSIECRGGRYKGLYFVDVVYSDIEEAIKEATLRATKYDQIRFVVAIPEDGYVILSFADFDNLFGAHYQSLIVFAHNGEKIMSQGEWLKFDIPPNFKLIKT